MQVLLWEGTYVIFAAYCYIVVNSSPPAVVATNTAFNITGDYILQTDTIPPNASRDCGIYSIAPAVFSPSYWDWIFWSGEYATLHYSIDGKDRGQIGSIGFSRGINASSSLGQTLNFSVPVSTSGMQLGSVHTASVFIQDTYGAGCYYVGWYLSWGRSIGPVIATATHQFTIADPAPNISIKLGKPSLTPCDAETGTIQVTSNDPTPNGGTVTLTFPDGSTASAAFVGKTATLTFADFGLPIGYSGTHKAGDVLNFNASVATAAGQAASSTATANVMAGGLTVTVVPVKTVVEPTLNNLRRWMQKSGANTTPITIQVSANNRPVTGASISLKSQLGTGDFGGHDHGADPANAKLKPLGTTSAVVDNNDGTYTTAYTASMFASEEKVIADASFKGCIGSASSPVITSKVPKLFKIILPPSGLHAFVGGTCNHFGAEQPWKDYDPTTPNIRDPLPASCQQSDNNHYLTAYRLGLLNRLLTLYLYINDASLQFGGAFDTNGDWAYKPHSNHRLGLDVDIAFKENKPPVNTKPSSLGGAQLKARLKKAMKLDQELKDQFEVKIHGGNHIHLKPNMKNWSGK